MIDKYGQVYVFNYAILDMALCWQHLLRKCPFHEVKFLSVFSNI
jgi:hypothetical protein